MSLEAEKVCMAGVGVMRWLRRRSLGERATAAFATTAGGMLLLFHRNQVVHIDEAFDSGADTSRPAVASVRLRTEDSCFIVRSPDNFRSV